VRDRHHHRKNKRFVKREEKKGKKGEKKRCPERRELHWKKNMSEIALIANRGMIFATKINQKKKEKWKLKLNRHCHRLRSLR
jgi:hypothetical protein